MARTITYREAINEALAQELERDESVIVMGENNAGLKVVVPATAYDAKGLLTQAIRDDDPVMFFEHKALYDMAGPVPEEGYALPFGEANVVREGGDVTIVTLGRMVHTSVEAAEQLATTGVQCEVVD